jgi:multidrug efflux pump subunit AcrA (membrane-fusion protein)
MPFWKRRKRPRQQGSPRKPASNARKRRSEAELREAEERKRAAEEAERKARAEAEAAERRREQARKDTEEAEARAKAAKEANEREIARQQVLAAKAEADRATIAKVEAEAEARAAKTEVREADRDATLAAGAAVRLEKRAERIEDKITDTAALSRTRGELGTVGSLARRWTYRVTDYDAIPLERLKPFLNRDAIDAAVYRLMQTGERDLPGVVFEQVEEARIA